VTSSYVLTAAAEPAQQVAAATGSFALTWLLIGLPVLGAVVLLVGGRRTDAWGHLLGCATVIGAFAVGLTQFLAMLGLPDDERAFRQALYSWIPVGELRVDVAFQLDQLSMCFVLLITGVGSLIHVYSIGYMAHDQRRRRFFGMLNLFVAAMLLLVLADSYLLLYVGWEGVGLASYLLIGFWQHVPEYATAAKKAFVLNRVGDLGLTIALMLMFATFGRVDFAGVFAGAGAASEGVLLAIGLLLLFTATGKSAQFPLQAWLLDAMAGPTPVSALIHAATMVTAGVYLVIRSAPIFEAVPLAATAVAVVGAITLLFGAIIGTAKDDIKKALAASTMSQIGYMMLAAGLGPAGYAFAIFHLLTHGFFKAGLFLGAGSVMHAMDDDTDMRRYGRLRTVMPLTYAAFGVSYLAIIGVPPFAGFFSKDKIVEAAFAENVGLGLAALLGAGITAFYMTRVMVLTFFGDRRWDDDAHPHESPPVMTVPVILLAAGAVLGGLMLFVGGGIVHWLAPVVGEEEHALGFPVWVLTVATLAVIVAGAALAYRQYVQQEVPRVAPVAGTLTTAARRDLYQDSVNEAVFMRPGQYLTRTLVYLENRGLDGIVNSLAAAIGGSAGRIRRLQPGFVRSYALTMFGGAALVVGALLLVRL
jgi:NADH-quinone oxidoreductase subunit L